MSTAHAKLRASYATAQRTQIFAPFFSQLCVDIAGSLSIADLDQLFRSPMCVEGIFDEGEFDGSVIDALVQLAVTVPSDATSAAALGWAVRATAFEPYAHLEVQRKSSKPQPLAALSKHSAVLFRQLNSTSVERRAAAGYALGVCQGLSTADLAVLLASLERESAPLPRASLLVSILAICHRGETTVDRRQVEQLQELASGLLTSADALVALSAAGCLAVLRETSPRILEHCAGALVHPAQLPRSWGWFADKPKLLKTSSLAIWFAGHVLQCRDPSSLIDALVDHTPIHQGEAIQVGQALMHLCFEARGLRLPKTGLWRGDVDAAIERCVRWLAGRPEFEQATAHSRLGLRHDDLLPFLDAKDVAWKPISLPVEGRISKPRLAQVYLHVGLGDVPEGPAVDAVLAALPPAKLAKVVFDGSPYFAEADTQLTEEDQRTRALCFRVALARRLLNATKLGLKARLSKPETNLPTALCLWLESHDLTDSQVPLAAQALGDVSCREPLSSLLRRRATPAQLEAVLRESYALEFFDLYVSDATLDQLFGILRDYPNSRLTALNTLQRARPQADDVLRRYAARPGLDDEARSLLTQVLGSMPIGTVSK